MGKIIDRIRQREAEARYTFIPTCGTEARLVDKMQEGNRLLEEIGQVDPGQWEIWIKPRPWWAFWRRG